jgi:hypothetical protein
VAGRWASALRVHVWSDINNAILDAIRRMRRQVARGGNQGRKKRRRRHSNKQPRAQKRRGDTLKQQSASIFKHHYLITKRRENLTPDELAILETKDFDWLDEITFSMVWQLPISRVLSCFER